MLSESGTLVGQRYVVIVAADADYLPQTSADPLPALEVFCQKYHILDIVHPELPGRNQSIHDSPIGLSRYYELDDNVYPTFLTDDGEEIDLFAFIHHANPTKVQIGKRQIEEGQFSLLDSTKGHVIPLVVKDDHGGQNDDIENRTKGSGGVGKGNRSEGDDRVGQEDNIIVDEDVQVVGLLERSTLAMETGVIAVTTMPFLTSSVTLTPEREGGGHIDCVSGPNLRTWHLDERFVISSDSSHHSSRNAADVEVTSIVRSSIPPPLVMTAVVATTAVASTSSALILGAGVEPAI
ncbi:hypothetical protein Tco_0941553 [Tanacetum coccineum]|uniref:Uncharacterized protein n=1 Tax=Tanacetum coccineum TaxID=301880 RepID=A0ABQ5DSR2_9ASTR